jgi:hypothetical protein
VAVGLLVRYGERLRNAPDVERFLVEGQPRYAGPRILFTKPDWDRWGRLAELLRRKEPPAILGKYTDGFTVEAARQYHEATYSICGVWPRRSTVAPAALTPSPSASAIWKPPGSTV